MEEGLERTVEVIDKGMFGGDTLEQYLKIFGSNSLIEPEKKLMLAILEDAIAVYRKYVRAKDDKGKNLFREAEEWISEEGSDWLFCFENICETLGIGPSYLRGGLMEWKERELSHKPSKNQKREYDLNAARGN